MFIVNLKHLLAAFGCAILIVIIITIIFLKILRSEVRTIVKYNGEIIKDVHKISKILISDNAHAIGMWGEEMLCSFLREMGLIENKHFYRQREFYIGGRKLIPDFYVIINGMSVIIDAKTPVLSYKRFIACENEDRESAFRDHARNVKKHLIGLQSKRYDKIGNNKKSIVLLFVPIECVVDEVLARDKELSQLCMDSNIVVVTRSTLTTILLLLNKQLV